MKHPNWIPVLLALLFSTAAFAEEGAVRQEDAKVEANRMFVEIMKSLPAQEQEKVKSTLATTETKKEVKPDKKAKPKKIAKTGNQAAGEIPQNQEPAAAPATGAEPARAGELPEALREKVEQTIKEMGDRLRERQSQLKELK